MSIAASQYHKFADQVAGTGSVFTFLQADKEPSPSSMHDCQSLNDLDVWLIGPDGTVVFPYVLDPSHPSQSACGRNDVDNVESVVVGNPEAGVWTVVVAGTRIALAPERFSLIVSAVGENAPLEIHPEGRCEVFSFFATKDAETADPIEADTRFTAGDPLNVSFAIGVPENADYGDYFGLVALVGSMTNAAGDLIVAVQNDTHQLPPVERFETFGKGLMVPSELPAGAAGRAAEEQFVRRLATAVISCSLQSCDS